jgi:hypothetical protein
VLVAAADVDGAGPAEIITGTGVGGGPRVIAFDARTLAPVADFFAFEDTFRGGVTVAGGDLTGDGRAELIAGTGPGGGPRVVAFDAADRTAAADFFAFEGAFRGGVQVAALDRDGDGVADVVTGAGPGVANRVRAFAADGSADLDLNPFTNTFDGGVFVG